MGHRRKAREYALQGLYMHETVGISADDLAGLGWVEKEIPGDIRDFAIDLIRGSIEHLEEIDSLIVKHLKNWKLERLDIIDKAILRISIYSMLHLRDVPDIVTIDEAIELGKMYGGENSGQFINGILDAIRISDLQHEE